MSKSVGKSLLACLCLLLVAWWAPVASQIGDERSMRFVGRLFDRRPNLEDRDRSSPGYYEALLHDSAQVEAPMSNVVVSLVGRWEQQSSSPPALIRQRSDFLSTAYDPNFHHDYTDLRTNRYGMADREYSMTKPVGTRRVAVLGDSLARGLGARFGYGWEPRLEQWLNAVAVTESGDTLDRRSIEVLNFAVDGYSITQLVDIVLERAPDFDPDMYLIVLSDRMVSDDEWSAHIVSLMRSGRDLKYGYLLREVAPYAYYANAGRSRYMRRVSLHKASAFQWALESMTVASERNGARIIVALMPSLIPRFAPNDPFGEIRAVVRDLRLPLIDLSEAFHDVQDFERLRFQTPYYEVDWHPNELGYELLFDRLRNHIENDPVIYEMLTGSAPQLP